MRHDQSLNTAIISSFAPDFLRQDWKSLVHASPPIPCELYVFMESDLDFLLNLKELSELKAKYHNYQNFSNLFSNLNHAEIELLANLFFNKYCKKTEVSPNPLEIVAFSTYIPEINHATRKNVGVRALGNTISFCCQLFQLIGKTRPTIEIVCGSTFDQLLEPCKSGEHKDAKTYISGCYHNKSTNYITKTKSHTEAINDFVGQLEEMFNLKDFDHLKTMDFQLACECEPGPYFLCNDFENVKHLCSRIDNSTSEYVRTRVGLNLDFAHWKMTDLIDQILTHHHYDFRPVNKQNLQHILSKIAHLHVSDQHALCHFGDIAIDPTDQDLYKPLLDLIQSIDTTQRQAGIKFDHTVALELEMATSWNYTLEAYNTLKIVTESFNQQKAYAVT